jgi:DNA-binding LytR/AlgR family response regulator
MKLNCVIVDDESGAQIVLENYCSKLDYAQVVGKFYNAVDALQFLNRNQVDVLYLDINMPEIDGFGLLNLLDQKPAVIFTTAYSEYALTAFEYGAIDYLHKPVRFERFIKAMEKAQKWCSVQKTKAVANYIELRIDGRLETIETAHIVYVEGLGNYIKLHTTHNKEMLVLMTMAEIEDKLPASSFVRTHKSYIVNTAMINKVSDGKIQLPHAVLPIGNTYKKYFELLMKTKK